MSYGVEGLICYFCRLCQHHLSASYICSPPQEPHWHTFAAYLRNLCWHAFGAHLRSICWRTFGAHVGTTASFIFWRIVVFGGGGHNAIFGHFPLPPSPLLSLSPPLGLFHYAATFLVAFAFQLPAWSVLSFGPKLCVFSGSKFCPALVSYSAWPMLPGYMVHILVICGLFDLISRRLLFCVSSCTDSIPKFHFG
jgi:hypothetical protein